MKAAGVSLLICVAALSTAAKADGNCDIIGKYNWWPFGTLKTCFMNSTAIDSKRFLITSGRDGSVEGFYAWENKQIEHLPNNLGAKFPSLVILYAADCSIKEVSRDNFAGLSKLQRLVLDGNQIEKIDDDTFEFIPAVAGIRLQRNKIKKLNSRAFASLLKLTTIDLTSNECIDEDFYTATIIDDLPRVVSKKCGF